LAELGLRVWIARVFDDNGSHAGAPGWMSAGERQRWSSLTDAGRRAFVASRRLLRDALAEATGLPADGWQVSAEAGSAPLASRLDSERGVAPQVSIAHCHGWVAVAVGADDGGAIGVDIECDRPPRSDPAERAPLVMQGDELKRWQALAASEREAALLRAWVAREAWFKAAGAGAPWDFRRLACEPCDAADANVRLWESGTLRVALCARDAGALAAASCVGWPQALDVRESSRRVSVPAND
jgi:phosphopantetheinyl transferase